MTVRTAGVLLVLAAFGLCAGPAQAGFPGTNGRIAFVSNEDGDNFTEIYSINPDGTDQQRLAISTLNDRDPAWSPDGTKIAFARVEPETEFGDIFVANADGSGTAQNLTNDPAALNREPVWSPGGDAIAYQGIGTNGGDIYRMNADGSGTVNLTNSDSFFESDPAWSPDGSRIAYTVNSGYGVDVYVMNADGTEPTNLTSDDDSRNRDPAWSPKGDKIAFTSDRNAGDDEIYVMNRDGSGADRLTTIKAEDSAPAWSPDGTKIVFQGHRAGLPFALYTMDATDGGHQTELAIAGGGVHPDWQPLDISRITIKNELRPANDPGRFDLLLGTTVLVAAAGDGDSRTRTVPPGTYGVFEQSVLFTALVNFHSSIACTKNGAPYVAAAQPSIFVDVGTGDHVVCTITNVRKNTSLGQGVVVRPLDATNGKTAVTITFGEVTDPGDTTLTTSTSGPLPPAGFQVQGVYYEISTTAVFDVAEVCFEYASSRPPKIGHFEGGTWVILPTRNTGFEVCADVTSFSPFALLQAKSAEDSEPPVISCDAADGVWHDQNVSIRCSAEDGASGLADPSDADFFISTSVPGGAEDADAPTATRQVCDAAGNCAFAGPIAGNKIDRRAPTLTLPPAKTVDATSPAGATVGCAASAADGADPTPVVSCTPASGSVFAIGTTTVMCTATDHVGNATTGTITVTVLGAKEQLVRLIRDVVAASGLSPAIKTQLLAKLEALVAALDTSNPVQRRIVCTGLAAFTSVVRLLSGHGIPPAQAVGWLADANRIRAVIGC
jgi:TolB protein